MSKENSISGVRKNKINIKIIKYDNIIIISKSKQLAVVSNTNDIIKSEELCELIDSSNNNPPMVRFNFYTKNNLLDNIQTID